MPSAVTSNQYNPAVTAAGSLFMNDVGTSTRSLRVARSISLDVTLGMAKGPGPGGVGQYQGNVSCARLPSQVKWSWIEDSGATGTSPALQALGTGSTNQHILLTLSTAAGSAVGFYSPNVCVSTVPVQFNNNGINSMKFEGVAHTGTTTTNDLTASALRMGWA